MIKIVICLISSLGIAGILIGAVPHHSHFDLSQSELPTPFPLHGKWSVAWNTLLSQQSLDLGEIKASFTETTVVPGFWPPNQTFGSTSYFTEVKVNPLWQLAGQEIGIESGHIFSSYQITIWNDKGELLIRSTGGKPALEKSEQIPTLLSRIVPINLHDAESIFILLEVSNHFTKKGGIESAPTIGLLPALKSERDRLVIMSTILIGCCVVIGLFHLIMYFQHHEDRLSLGFALFCLSIAIRESTSSDLFEVLGQSSLLVFNGTIRIAYLSMPIIIICGWHFFKSLNLANDRELRFSKLICVHFGYILASLAIFTPVLVFSKLAYLYQVQLIVAQIVGSVVVIKYALRGNKLAQQVIASFFILFIGVMNDILYYRQWIDTTWLSTYTFIAFILTQSSIISGRSARAYRRAKHSYQQLAKVFYPHQIAKMEAGLHLEESMPIGEGMACVICFDIVSSGAIRVPGTKEFFRGLFRECGKIMMKDYSTTPLQTTAFRVKEMGDGFICTVGFPLPSPASNIFQESVKLAERFVEILQVEQKKFDYSNPIYCGIGIAYGSVESFYPESPPIEYDLFGHGIVLAKRYEEMRKLIFGIHNVVSNIVIVQGTVFDQLSKAEQDQFEELDLRQHGLGVRDDQEAQFLYYKRIGKNDCFNYPQAS